MAFADPISNEALRLKDIPPRGSEWSAIIRFAQTFNGYEQMGGIKQCGEVENHQRECKTLSDLRAWLFFEYRRYNHFGRDPDSEKMGDIFDLLDRIRDQITA